MATYQLYDTGLTVTKEDKLLSLEFMDSDERREMLEDAGLDPDEFDF